MPVSLGEWRVRIGTFVRRESKEHDYNYCLRKLLYLMKNNKKAKQPESNIPERRNTSCRTGVSHDTNISGDNANHQFASNVNTSENNLNAPPMERGPSCGSNNPPGEATSKVRSTDSQRCNSVTENRSPCDVEISGYNCTPHLNSGHANAEKNGNQVSWSPTEDHDKDYSQCLTSPASSGAATSYPPINEYQNKESFRPTFDHDDGGNDDQLDCREIILKPTCCTQLASLVKNDTPPENVSPSCRSLASATSANDGSSGSHEGSVEVKLEYQVVTPTTAKSGKIVGEIDAMEGNQCPDTTNILLLRAGDVELNPGPNETPRNLTELELYLLADGMDPSDFRKVGQALGFSEAQLRRFEKDQPNTMQATYQMLYEWRKTVHDSDARNALVNKLEHLQLIQLADSLRRGQAGEHIPSMTEEEIRQVAEDVKRYFTIDLCQIQADPLNSELLLQFERIFTNLKLMEEDKGTKKKTPLAYSDLLKTKVNGIYPKRLLVEGEGGVGKTTLCAKIAWDWIQGVGYHDFKLVLVILLRKAKNKTVGEIVKSYLSDNNPVTAMQLDKYILTHPDDVFLVLDGLDELAADLDSVQQLIQITLNRLFKSGTVLITSRQWRSDEIRNNSDLRKAFAFITVEGFSAAHLASYITKFFHLDKVSSEDLKSFVSDNDVIRENMAPFPVFTAMLCIMWKEFDGERREAMRKLHTFSQLFDLMINFLVDHYLSKDSMAGGNAPLNERRSAVFRHLTLIGQIAFHGLRKRQMVFPKEDFQGCPGSLHMGCKVGVLTRENRIPSMRERRANPDLITSTVQFPHKLFQEYLSGMYLASLYSSNLTEYKGLMKDILKYAYEYRNLLYFTSAQRQEIGSDIARRLMSCHDNVNDDFIVDVAFESQDQTVAKVVAAHLTAKSKGTLTIGSIMQAHTISAHCFILKHRAVDDLVVEKPCGRTASEDLAEFMCLSPSLRSATIIATMHVVFYSVLAEKAVQSKIETLDIQETDLSERSSASCDLAQFICKMPHLQNLTLGAYDNKVLLHDDFYSTTSSMASSVKIETLNIETIDLGERSSASRDFAQFICRMPYLKKLTFGRYNNEVLLHDDFYSTSSLMASSVKIKTLQINGMDLSKRSSASRDLAQFICKMPHLKNLTLGMLGPYDHEVLLHDDFYSTTSSMASSVKLESIAIQRIDLSERSSASRDLAQFICKMPHLKDLTLDRVHDDFYLTASSMTSSVKIETLDIWRVDLRERSSASRDLALFLCKIPHLKKLTLDRVHDDFYSTSSSMASSVKVETLHIGGMALSEHSSASRDFAQFICKMPHLKNLTLGRYKNAVVVHDDFYSTASSMAPSAKIEALAIERVDLSKHSFPSRDLAQFICKMPHLKNMTLGTFLDTVVFHDDFYSTASSMASSVKIETLDVQSMDLTERPSASRDLAQFICQMPHLKNLTLCRVHDDFYSTASSMASSAKIETLHIGGMVLSERSSASRDLTQFICKMPYLKNLKLDRVHDDFYSTASSLAKIETLHIGGMVLSECSSASHDLSQFICKMPHLKNLTLDRVHDEFSSTASSMVSSAKNLTLGEYSHDDNKVLLHDDFSSTASSMASSGKVLIAYSCIETLSIVWTDISEGRLASQDLAHFICKMPYLKHVRLFASKFHQDFWSKSLAACKHGEQEDDQVCNMSLTLTELTVDDKTLKELQDRVSMLDCLKKVTLRARGEIRSDVVLKIHLPGAIELTIETCSHELGYHPVDFRKRHSEICSAILNACPHLIKMIFSDIIICNSQIKPILQAFSSVHHKHLKTIRFIRCGTDESMDAFILEYNKDHIMKVEMEHGEPLC